MRNKTIALFLVSVVMLIGWIASPIGSAQTRSGSGIDLQRFIDHRAPLPGESVTIRFEITNYEPVTVDYTLIEEVPVDVTIVDAGEGSYNQTAGFIVWRGTLASGEHAILSYDLRTNEDTRGVLPLYAYISTTLGAVLDHADQLEIAQLDWQLALGETLLQKGDHTTVRLRVANPSNRPLSLDFAFEAAKDLQLEQSFPTTLRLEPGDEWVFETAVMAEAVGSHSIRATPLIGGVVAASPRQVTLTLYDGERPRPEKQTAVETGVQRQPITTERVHEVRLPVHLLDEGEELLLAARIPPGAGFVPGSARLDGEEALTPRLSGDYVLFSLPHVERVTVRYALTYQDRSMLDRHVPDAYNDVGLISMGSIPRVLRGDEELLYVVHGEQQVEPRKREGAAILAPFDGQVFTEREQIDIEVDGPVESQMTLRVNETVISRDRVGAISKETERVAEKYIAVPLRVGANRLELTVVTAEGEELNDTITVYRSGPMTDLSITPISDMVTGSVHPLLIQVTATDQDGLAPADGTPITVDVTGAELLTADAHPDWVGHQVLLYGGRALLQIESPAEAGVVSIAARLADVTEEMDLAVTARAEDWFLLSLGTLRAERLFSPQGVQPNVSGDLRLVARGPVRSGVFTAAIDTRANPHVVDPHTLWTGDTATSGFLVGSGEPVHLQLERGLSYVRYGMGRVEFAGDLGRYNRAHKGFQATVYESSNFLLHSFVSSEAMGRLQEVFEGDGTGYYRLDETAIQPNSEDLTIIVREPFFPYDIVREQGLTRSEYSIDYRTGQIWLREPLLSRDANGNRMYLRIRYNLEGEPLPRAVGGLQATWHLESGLVRATARLARDPYGEAAQLYSVGGQWVGPHDMTLDLETALVQNDMSSIGYVVGLTHPSVYGWEVRIGHRNIDGRVASVIDGVQEGIVTSVAGERRMQGLRLAARASINQEQSGDPWTTESELEADWMWRGMRPSLGVKVQHGLDTPLVTTLRPGIGINVLTGSVALSREFPLIGEHAVHDIVDGRLNLSRGLDLLFSIDRETDSFGETETRNAVSITQTLESAGATTVLRGGYEYSDTHEPDGAMVYSATSLWPLNDEHALQLVVDHRRPLSDEPLPSFGGQIGWTYRNEEAESTFRIDHRADGHSVKQSFQGRAFQPVNDELALQLDASFIRDDDVQMGTRVELSGAYRADTSAILASTAMEHHVSPAGVKRSSEWRLKGAHRLSPEVLLNLGYAQRTTDAPTVTDKIGLGVLVRLSERHDFVFDGSLLRQHESETNLVGTRVGVGYQLTEELTITVGYAASDYVGFDSVGSSFATRRSGAFVEVDIAIDELNIAGWFGRSKEG